MIQQNTIARDVETIAEPRLPHRQPAEAGKARPAGDATINVAIAGAGYIAQYHLAVLRGLSNVRVVAACDPNAERLAELCRQWQIPAGETSLDALLPRHRPDVVHILTPPPAHFSMARTALEAGAHVLVEKPLALCVADCDTLRQLATSCGLRLGTNHNAVYQPPFQRLLRDVAAGKLGRIDHVVSTHHLPLAQLLSGQHDHWMFHDPANILFEQGPHAFSQICELLGPVQRISAETLAEQPLRGGGTFVSRWQFSVTCERGSAQVFLSFERSLPRSTLTVFGQDGSAHVDLLNNLYVLDRPTRFMEPVDFFLRGLNRSRQIATGSIKNASSYALSTLRLTGRSDPFYVSMRDSIRALYTALATRSEPVHRERSGNIVIEALEKAAASASRGGNTIIRRLPKTLTRRAPEPGEILVLGGTGFIGQALVPALHSAGHSIRLLARRPDLLPATFARCDPSVCTGDIRNESDLRRVVENCRAVIHLATSSLSSWAEYEQVFVEGTRQLAQACLDQRVEQFIFASSISVYPPGGRIITESTECDPLPNRRNDYVRAKIECERLLMELHRTRQLPLTIFRPGVVVGRNGLREHSGVGYWTGDTHCTAWGRNVDRPLPFVLVDDVAAALASAIGRPDVVGRSFNLVGDVQLSAAEYIAALRAASARDIHLHRQSLATWMAIDTAKWAVKAIARKPENPFPSWRDLAARSLAHAFDCSAAKDFLSWRPVADRDRLIELALTTEQ